MMMHRGCADLDLHWDAVRPVHRHVDALIARPLRPRNVVVVLCGYSSPEATNDWAYSVARTYCVVCASVIDTSIAYDYTECECVVHLAQRHGFHRHFLVDTVQGLEPALDLHAFTWN